MRTVPTPDPIATEYLRLVLRLDQHRPGLLDAYYGPASLKAEADMAALRSPTALAEDAMALRERVAAEVDDVDRRGWLIAQLTALEAQARESAGERASYADLVGCYFDHPITPIDDAVFDAASAELEAVVPGNGALDARLAAWDAGLTIDPDRVAVVADHLARLFRARAARVADLAPGESARLSMVRDRPWAGYNWYEGGMQSRVEINLDLPVRAGDLLHTVAHETYPGHHLEASTKEWRLVEGAGRLELSALTINTPECLLHEGIADLGVRFVAPPDEEPAILAEVVRVAGLPLGADRAATAAAAETQARIGRARQVLRGISGNAAWLRHVEGRSREDVIDYLVTVGRVSPDRASQRLDFIDHPLWRTYVFVYREGERLLSAWLALGAEDDRSRRFARLLGEARSPSAIAAELAAPGA